MNFKIMKLFKWDLQATHLTTTRPTWIPINTIPMMASQTLKTTTLQGKTKNKSGLSTISSK
jgi:hypothetical protein